MKKTINFRFEGKKYSVKNYIICDNVFSKARGLMFRPKKFKTPLLFVFSKPGNYAIHSFFCRKFIAIWMHNKKIIDVKLVSPWKLSVLPKGKFNFLMEVPLLNV